nr:hypothetical protein [Salinibacter sp.]
MVAVKVVPKVFSTGFSRASFENDGVWREQVGYRGTVAVDKRCVEPINCLSYGRRVDPL